MPERTFWEKATILHHEANRPKDKSMPIRYARHYYDLYCISNSKYKNIALNNLDILKSVLEFKDKFYPKGWAKYNETNSKNIILIPDE
ncbi:nucleotidyl transferase AbiEii/AbiGii toxin family protein [Mycoplasma sp. CSL7503-lung]|uniref:nucleotidyl transferase AbiEii/AbiGii toxin family protein n=1 Tax=Mycoplasma sp. CSL7503-lung TaxID=536372 RepID=UPI0021D29DE4|nr:nucleotidyl transferase AbiEii/AbiGii toxin family protein [Mycoplasma sp. CSL7503-lung]MCU4706812.1 nucleotidyl transferase AbiEii/AbiGii toxin family protein [Mycoplasma sp. CSL7503-lung]